jgi:asparagine synthase (glutamine-hydrolysing)
VSGIVGLWNFDGAPAQRGLLERLAAAIQHRGPDATGIWTEGPAGLAACLLRVTPESRTEIQPLIAPGEAAVVFDGRLDNREEILADALDSGGISAASPDPALVLAAYRRHGEKFAEHLNGDFALALFDIRTRQLFLARDCFGVRPLYYARIGESFIFASEIKAILAHPEFHRVPNEDALAVFLANGSSHDARGETLFSGVYVCPPAHVLTVTSQNSLPTRYWSFERVRLEPLQSAGEYAEGFRWHFERAVQRRIRSAYPVAVSLSGGLDSSSVFCSAEAIRRRDPQSGASILGVSLVYPDASPANESQFLAAMEQKWGTTILRVPVEPECDTSTRNTLQGIWHAEIPLMDAQSNESRTFYKTVATRGARVVLTGHWGDQVLDDSSHLVDLFHSLRFSALWDRLRGFPRWREGIDPGHVRQQFLQDLLRYQKRFLPEFVVRILRRLRARHHLQEVYSDSLRRSAKQAEWHKTQAPTQFSSFHAQSLCTKLTSGYYLSCFEEHNKVASMHGMEIAFPFMDRDMIGFVMRVPPEDYSKGAVPRALLRQAMRGVVPDGILDRRRKADFSGYINESARSQYVGFDSVLQGASQIVKRGYVHQDLLGPELERLSAQIHDQGPNCEAAWDLQKLCRLELWLQTFFSEGRTK